MIVTFITIAIDGFGLQLLAAIWKTLSRRRGQWNDIPDKWHANDCGLLQLISINDCEVQCMKILVLFDAFLTPFYRHGQTTLVIVLINNF